MVRTVVLAALIASTGAFVTSPARMSVSRSTTSVDAVSRRQLFRGFGVAVAGAAGVVLQTAPASAASLSSVNARLAGYGLPLVPKPPDGMKPLLEVYGRDQARETLLVTWNYPGSWIVQRPNLDTNSEEGTVSTGDYGKGDSAFLFILPKDQLGGKEISVANRDAVEDVVRASLSQKGGNQFQNFKVKKITEGSTGVKGEKYVLVDFKYDLLTGAGFIVERAGCASVTQVGKGIQSVVAVTTVVRFKKLKDQLEEVARSFKVYDGIIVDKLTYADV